MLQPLPMIALPRVNSALGQKQLTSQRAKHGRRPQFLTNRIQFGPIDYGPVATPESLLARFSST